MKVVNCVHCGTPNMIQEKGGVPARCIKCGNYVEASMTLLSMFPTKILNIMAIGGVLLFLLFPLFLYLSTK